MALHIFSPPEYHGMSGKPLRKNLMEVFLMCNNGFCGGNNCWWIIILVLLFCCGCGNNNYGSYSNNNSCGCDHGCC